MSRPLIHKGRASISNATGRFEKQSGHAEDDGWGGLDADLPPLATEVIVDSSKSVITYNDSPDIPFDRSINPYRGCEHGCIYCFARPTHAYLGYSPGLDFESRILIKPDAARLLREELGKRNYRCAPLALGTNTDPYQPLGGGSISRGFCRCWRKAVIRQHRHQVGIDKARRRHTVAEMATRAWCRWASRSPRWTKSLARTGAAGRAAHRRLEALTRLREARRAGRG